MGIDADVHLKVRDRAALRTALDAYAARDRARWADEGREAEYDQLVADGYDPIPLLRPHADGSVSIFTALRFGDADMEFAIRCWLHEHFGDALARIHDDPRGVFVTPDVCDPRADTYDGILRELAGAGRWIDPRPPTDEEHAERARRLDEYIAGMDQLRAAAEDGGDALAAVLATVPEHVRASWEEQADQIARMQRLVAEPTMPLAIDPEKLAHLEAMFAGMLGDAIREAEERADDPRGHGRISAAVPAPVWSVLEKERRGGFDVDDYVRLADGGALVVTTRLGEEDEGFMAQNLAAVIEEAGLDRASIGPLPFFRESLVDEVRDARDVAAVVERLGARAKMLPLRTFDEAFREETARTKAWLGQ